MDDKIMEIDTNNDDIEDEEDVLGQENYPNGFSFENEYNVVDDHQGSSSDMVVVAVSPKEHHHRGEHPQVV